MGKITAATPSQVTLANQQDIADAVEALNEDPGKGYALAGLLMALGEWNTTHEEIDIIETPEGDATKAHTTFPSRDARHGEQAFPSRLPSSVSTGRHPW